MQNEEIGLAVDWVAYEQAQQNLMGTKSFVGVERQEIALNSLLSGRTRSSSGRKLADNLSGSGRKQAIDELRLRGQLVDSPTSQPGPYELMERQSHAALVSSAVSRVGARDADLGLRLLEGDDKQEIAADLGITDRHVRGRLRALGEELCRQPLVAEAISNLREHPLVLLGALQPALEARAVKVS